MPLGNPPMDPASCELETSREANQFYTKAEWTHSKMARQGMACTAFARVALSISLLSDSAYHKSHVMEAIAIAFATIGLCMRLR